MMKKIIITLLIGGSFFSTSCAYKTCATYTKNDVKKELKVEKEAIQVVEKDIRG